MKKLENTEGLQILITEGELDLLIKKVANQLNKTYENCTETVHIIGLLTGAFYFLGQLVKHLNFKYNVHFLKVSSYSGEKQLSVLYEKDALMPYEKEPQVVFCDELIDSGSTMQALIDRLPNARVCAALTKGKPADFVGCDIIPKAWLLGFGLDDYGEKRGWPHLFCKNMTHDDFIKWRTEF